MAGTLRNYVAAGTRTTVGAVGLDLPSRSHENWGVQGEMPGNQPTRWTPWGTFVAQAKPLNRLRNLGPSSPTMSPGAYFTPPALFQIIGIPEPFLQLQVKPSAGRSGTPPIRHFAINPFPSFRPPLPTYPAPAAYRGVL